MRLLEALEDYRLQLEADGRARSTIEQYARHVGLLAAWLGEHDELDGIDHRTVARFLVSERARLRADGRPKKASAMNCLRSSLRAFFGWLADAGYLDRNPARLVRRARCGTPPPRGLTDDEQARLVAALDAAEGEAGVRDRALFGLILASGIRIGSALGLDIEDVDLEACELTLRHAKGDRVERVFLSPRAVELLRPIVQARGSGPVFVSRHGTRLTARQVARRLDAAAREAGIARRIGPHALRHSFALGLYARTGDVLVVKQALGHRAISSTLVYARCDSGRVREAVADAVVA